MNRIVISLCSFLLASAGWWLGELAGGIYPAFALSMVGMGLGIYFGKRIVNLWDV